ncbi:hypothetical protein M1523_02000 [Patescibacteria group bacterium]|nr:hypothetical protein [Patescibacteria group bacterium]MCL5091984.1 hypothetical protein [Patescibacteria group bacterium]
MNTIRQSQRGIIAAPVVLAAVMLLSLSTLAFTWLNRHQRVSVNSKAAEGCIVQNEYKTECANDNAGCPSDAGVALVYQCDKGQWVYKYPECQTRCRVGATAVPTTLGCVPGTVINAQLRKECDTSLKKMMWVESFYDDKCAVQTKTGKETGESCGLSDMKNCQVGAVAESCVRQVCDTAKGVYVCVQTIWDSADCKKTKEVQGVVTTTKCTGNSMITGTPTVAYGAPKPGSGSVVHGPSGSTTGSETTGVTNVSKPSDKTTDTNSTTPSNQTTSTQKTTTSTTVKSTIDSTNQTSTLNSQWCNDYTRVDWVDNVCYQCQFFRRDNNPLSGYYSPVKVSDTVCVGHGKPNPLTSSSKAATAAETSAIEKNCGNQGQSPCINTGNICNTKDLDIMNWNGDKICAGECTSEHGVCSGTIGFFAGDKQPYRCPLGKGSCVAAIEYYALSAEAKQQFAAKTCQPFNCGTMAYEEYVSPITGFLSAIAKIVTTPSTDCLNKAAEAGYHNCTRLSSVDWCCWK